MRKAASLLKAARSALGEAGGTWTLDTGIVKHDCSNHLDEERDLIPIGKIGAIISIQDFAKALNQANVDDMDEDRSYWGPYISVGHKSISLSWDT